VLEGAGPQATRPEFCLPAFPKSYADRVARLRVPGGFVLVAAFAWFSRPTPASLAWSVPVSLVGLVLRAWAAGCLAKNRELAVTGPYAYTRNPLYLGTLLVAAGLVIASRQMGLAVLFAAVFALVYLPVIQLEEQHLRKLFPGYESYGARVPALWPRGRAWPERGSQKTFSWRQYWKNREYQAAAGYAAGLALLVWKAVR
jgi:protein-S-isoprenylcysteine O-methyltransferase Ste14